MQLAMFCRIGILRDFCEKCGYTALVLDGKMTCCDTPIQLNQAITSLRREAITLDVKRLNQWQQRHILEQQGYRCFYCFKLFGSICFYKGKEVKLTKHFDHIIPLAFQRDNSLPNIAAACKQCNLWKGSRIFTSIEEARLFLSEKWEQNRNAPKAKKANRVKVVRHGVTTSDE